MSTQIIVNSDSRMLEALAQVQQQYQQYRYVKLTLQHERGRSLDQNALSHVWYNEIAKATGATPDEVHCECKLVYGVPILRAEDAEFRSWYDESIKHAFNYEQKLRAMRYLPVTRLMTKPQLSRYLEHIQMTFARQGIQLHWPEEHNQ